MPGWYGRTEPTNNASLDLGLGTHRDSLLIPNGETFPIRLPPRVSLKGTSALNTIIDTGQIGTAIEFGRVVNGISHNGQGTFLDKITFYACGGLQAGQGQVSPGPAFERDPKQCCAILIDDGVASRPTITNCFFLRNAVGILVNASADGSIVHDGTTVMNCTVAWNLIGLWNGQISATPPGSSVGRSRLVLVNNIFDASPPERLGQNNDHFPCAVLASQAWWPIWTRTGGGNPQHPQGVFSAFEGVSQSDLRVQVGGAFIDTNAYEFGTDPVAGPYPAYNLGPLPISPQGILGLLPVTTTPRVATAFLPGIDIAPITGWNNQLRLPNDPLRVIRGILYVSDLFCHGRANPPMGGPQAFPTLPTNQTPPYGMEFDGSMHDLRLAPATRNAYPGDAILAPDQLNPLVDRGWFGPFPGTMENGLVVREPGTLVLDEGNWPHTAMDADAEGYGNPRRRDDPVHPNGSTGSVIDIGADEVGELIVAGYRFGSTSFVGLSTTHLDNRYGNLPTAAATVDKRRVWFLGPPTGVVYAPTAALPIGLPHHRVISWSAGGFTYNAFPSAYGAVTWHSAEATPPRPWGAIRSMGRQLSPLVVPPGIATTLQGVLQDIGNSYRATSADVTPALLPDIHPWWSHWPLNVDPAALLYRTSPFLPIWQNGPGCSNYIQTQTGLGGIYNWFLYQAPSTPSANPPGAGVNAPKTINGLTFQWLDDASLWQLGSLATVSTAPFQVTFASAQMGDIASFDAWCRGSSLGPPPIPEILLPSSVPAGATEASAIRYTLEWPDNTATQQWEPNWPTPPGYIRVKNMQTFLAIGNL